MNRGAWWATVHGVTKNWTQLNNYLRPQERVPEVPVVSRVNLPQFEKIQEVLPSRRDEAHFR